MPKITMLGAGSGFAPRLVTDIAHIEGLAQSEIRLVDIDPKRLKIIAPLCRKIMDLCGREKWGLTATTDRREVLAGSDYLINFIEVSGVKTVRLDNDIPEKYGVTQCIGDTIGPGGIMKALRTIPSWLEILGDAERLCPKALVLNYTNPMSMMTLAAVRASRLPVVGLCHSVQGTSEHLARWLKVPYQDFRWRCAGINHMAWFTELTYRGKDQYPRLHRICQAPEVYEQDPIRIETMWATGYFVTESSGHFSEYVPYFRKRRDLIRKYCRPHYRGESGFYARDWPKWRRDVDAHRRRQLAGKAELSLRRSHEFASNIIEAVEKNQPTVIHGSVLNAGLIPNLPAEGVVEVPVMIDRSGLNPIRFGPLPEVVGALCRSNMAVYELTVQAILEKDAEKVYHAVLLDPNTASVCSPAETRRMTDELLKAERRYVLPWTQSRLGKGRTVAKSVGRPAGKK